MALNFSHRQIFPAHSPEDNIVQGGSQEKDIRDILPADPFGMDISSTVTAITGWLEDLAVSDYGGCQGGEVGIGKGQYPIFAGWNFWWDTAVEFQPFLGHKKKYDTLFRGKQCDGFITKEALGCFFDGVGARNDCCSMENALFGCGTCGGDSVSRGQSDRFVGEEIVGQFVDDGGVSYGSGTVKEELLFGDTCEFENVIGQEICEAGATEDDGSPHPAFSFALAYLGVRDLLNVERVCKSLRVTVQNDPLFWRNIHIDHPLNERITDEVLIQLTNRAQGHLRCLSLVECKITDECLRRILESNPRLIKLSVPGCSKLSIDGVIRCLKTFQIGAGTGLKYLRLGGLGVPWTETSEHFERFSALTSLLGIHNHVQPNNYKPHFYRRGNLYLSSEDNRSLDIEICSKCEKLRLVYDCPAESCQTQDQAGQSCRACILCMPRCIQCGRCVNDVVYEETFFLELLCSDCLQDLKCHEGHDIGSTMPEHSVLSELDG